MEYTDTDQSDWYDKEIIQDLNRNIERHTGYKNNPNNKALIDCYKNEKEWNRTNKEIKQFYAYFNRNIVPRLYQYDRPKFDEMTNFRHVADVGKFHYTKNDGFYQFIKELEMTPYFKNRKNYKYWIYLRERYLNNIKINNRAQKKK